MAIELASAFWKWQLGSQGGFPSRGGKGRNKKASVVGSSGAPAVAPASPKMVKGSEPAGRGAAKKEKQGKRKEKKEEKKKTPAQDKAATSKKKQKERKDRKEKKKKAAKEEAAGEGQEGQVFRDLFGEDPPAPEESQDEDPECFRRESDEEKKGRQKRGKRK